MKWRRKTLTKPRESVPHFFQNIRTVLACGRCTIPVLYAFSSDNLFKSSFKMAVSLIFTFLSKVIKRVGEKKRTAAFCVE